MWKALPKVTAEMARRFVITSLALVSSSAVIYTIYLHQTLSRKVKHVHKIGLPKADDDDNTMIESLPADLADPSKFHVISDIASKSVPSVELPKCDDPSLMLTKYLQRNMSCFTRFPQALLLKLVFTAPETRDTFRSSFVEKLNFIPGDIVCGAYKVEVRRPDKVEFGMVSLEGLPPMNGRLVISVQPKGEQTLFVTETLQWRRRDEKTVLPLERAAMKWLHELASWWLLETGTKRLCGLNLAT